MEAQPGWHTGGTASIHGQAGRIAGKYQCPGNWPSCTWGTLGEAHDKQELPAWRPNSGSSHSPANTETIGLLLWGLVTSRGLRRRGASRRAFLMVRGRHEDWERARHGPREGQASPSDSGDGDGDVGCSKGGGGDRLAATMATKQVSEDSGPASATPSRAPSNARKQLGKASATQTGAASGPKQVPVRGRQGPQRSNAANLGGKAVHDSFEGHVRAEG